MNEWNRLLHEAFLSSANAEAAKRMSAYVKNHFSFYGLKTPERKAIVSRVWKKYGAPPKNKWEIFSKQSFSSEFPREMQYAVGDLLRPIAAQIEPGFLDTIEWLVQRLSWWDTIDWLAPKLAGNVLGRHPELIVRYPDRWIRSDNVWLVRSAILHQLHQKERTDKERLEDYCLRHKHAKAFFIQKAMGWALREYSKSNGDWVREFLNSNELPKLTAKEGSKYLNR
jgi:3-methyladenine DNA glycosylase AlkD